MGLKPPEAENWSSKETDLFARYLPGFIQEKSQRRHSILALLCALNYGFLFSREEKIERTK
jgi:hypothetical protein